MNQERKKKYMLKLSILGVRIYVCNLNLKPYLRKLDNRSASIRNERRREIYERGGGKCERCGKPLEYTEMQLHHVVPATMNGTNNPHNLMCLCHDCHKLIHGNPYINQLFIERKLREHPEVRVHGTKKLVEEVKEVRKRKTLYQWQMPGITFKVIQ